MVQANMRTRTVRVVLAAMGTVIAGAAGAADTHTLLRLVHERFIPNKILLLADGGRGQKQLVEWLPFIQSVSHKQGRPTAYICENYVCKLPTNDPQTVARLLEGKSQGPRGWRRMESFTAV